VAGARTTQRFAAAASLDRAPEEADVRGQQRRSEEGLDCGPRREAEKGGSGKWEQTDLHLIIMAEVIAAPGMARGEIRYDAERGRNRGPTHRYPREGRSDASADTKAVKSSGHGGSFAPMPAGGPILSFFGATGPAAPAASPEDAGSEMSERQNKDAGQEDRGPAGGNAGA